MAASREDIERWFNEGVETGARYMLVICDTYDHDDYPVFCKDADHAKSRMKSPGQMQRIMECYDLQADKAAQMKQHRAMALVA